MTIENQDKSSDVIRFEKCLELKEVISKRLTSAEAFIKYKKEELDALRKKCVVKFGEDSPDNLGVMYKERVAENENNVSSWIKELGFLEDKVMRIESILDIHSNESRKSRLTGADIEVTFKNCMDFSSSISKRLARIESAGSFAKRELDELRELCRERFGEYQPEPLGELYHDRVAKNNTSLDDWEKGFAVATTKLNQAETIVNAPKAR